VRELGGVLLDDAIVWFVVAMGVAGRGLGGHALLGRGSSFSCYSIWRATIRALSTRHTNS